MRRKMKPSVAQKQMLVAMRKASIVLSNGEYRTLGGSWHKPRAATISALVRGGFLTSGMKITPVDLGALQEIR